MTSAGDRLGAALADRYRIERELGDTFFFHRDVGPTTDKNEGFASPTRRVASWARD